jgi:ribosomal protein L14E/L6E/L27E
MMIEPGRICIVKVGSDAGKEVVVNEIIDKNFVMIAGERVKQRRINLKHLEPTPRKGAVIVPIKKEEKAKKAAPKKTEEKK